MSVVTVLYTSNPLYIIQPSDSKYLYDPNCTSITAGYGVFIIRLSMSTTMSTQLL